MYENNNNNQSQYGYHDASRLYGQPIYPENKTYPGWQPSEKKPDRPKKDSKAAKIIATATAMVMLSAVSGGGAAWLVLNNADTQVAASPAPTSSMQTAVTNPVITAEGGSVAAVASSAANSVVEITTETVQNSPFIGQAVVEGAGSGVILTQDGYIVTNNHVVEDGTSYKVRTKDGTEYDAKLIGTDAKTDLAVIKIEATGLQAVTFADSDNIQVGEMAVAIGNPLGELGGTVTSGIISATGREITIGGETMNLLQTSAAVNPGNSGGGLFNQDGSLVGVVNAKSSGAGVEGLAFAIPANTVKQVSDEIIANGYVTGRPEMGISVVEINDARTAVSYGLQETGVYIASAGKVLGLQNGDRIVSLGGTEVANSADVSDVLAEHSVGDVLTMIVMRDGKEFPVDITLHEQAPANVADAI